MNGSTATAIQLDFNKKKSASARAFWPQHKCTMLYFQIPYREDWEHYRVLAYIWDKAGSQFDPALVRAFMKVHPAA